MPLGYNNDDGAQALDQQQEIDYRRGWQVVDAASGSNVVTDGTGSYEVDVAAGDINTPSGTVTCSAATLDLQSLVAPDLPRIVTVYRDASGVAQTLAGPPAAKQPEGETAPGPIYQPAPDAFSTTDGVVLATVLLEAAASSVGSAQIRDRRLPASLNVDSAEFGSVNTGSVRVGSHPLINGIEVGATSVDLDAASDSSTDTANSTIVTITFDSEFDNPPEIFTRPVNRGDNPILSQVLVESVSTTSADLRAYNFSAINPVFQDIGWLAVDQS